MSLHNTTNSYGSIAKLFHWLTVLLILSALPLGIIANDLAHQINAPDHQATQSQISRATLLFSLHKTLGVAVFFVALARILWAISQPKPGLLNGDQRAESVLAEIVHWLLYGSLVLVPLSGWIHHSATTGFAPIWWPFGQALPFVPQSESVAQISAALHVIFERVLIVSIVLHVAGAFKHHFVDRDATLRRMLPGATTGKPTVRQPGHMLPLLGALVIWAGALTAGAGLGLFQPAHDHHTHNGPAPVVAPISAPALDQADSQWQIDQGALNIAITQLGARVDGNFADWTAQIIFDPAITEGPAGSVNVAISVASLSLGSVSDQAMGFDFFDVANHAMATFQADILPTPDSATAYVAQGLLTIKGTAVPINLPFDLQLSGDASDTAQMQGHTTLQRLDFGVGNHMPDGSSLGLDVEVDISLTATRQN